MEMKMNQIPVSLVQGGVLVLRPNVEARVFVYTIGIELSLLASVERYVFRSSRESVLKFSALPRGLNTEGIAVPPWTDVIGFRPEWQFESSKTNPACMAATELLDRIGREMEMILRLPENVAENPGFVFASLKIGRQQVDTQGHLCPELFEKKSGRNQ